MKKLTRETMAVTSIAIGIIAISISYFFPKTAGLFCIAGFIFGGKGIRSSRQEFAITGIAICIVAIILANLFQSAWMFDSPGNCAPSSGGG